MGTVKFKVNIPQLLKEIADAGLGRSQGVLKIPMNIMQTYLALIAQRATELDDPILNELMCDTCLYELPDPRTPEYEPIITKVKERAEQYRKDHATTNLPGLEH